MLRGFGVIDEFLPHADDGWQRDSESSAADGIPVTLRVMGVKPMSSAPPHEEEEQEDVLTEEEQEEAESSSDYDEQEVTHDLYETCEVASILGDREDWKAAEAAVQKIPRMVPGPSPGPSQAPSYSSRVSNNTSGGGLPDHL